MITPILQNEWDRFKFQIEGNAIFEKESNARVENSYRISTDNSFVNLIWSNRPDIVTNKVVARTELGFTLHNLGLLLEVYPKDFWIQLATLLKRKIVISDPTINRKFIVVCSDMGLIEKTRPQMDKLLREFTSKSFFLKKAEVDDQNYLVINVNQLLSNAAELYQIYQIGKELTSQLNDFS